jgi:glycosyltransferase involved in cell wall biosynthesis
MRLIVLNDHGFVNGGAAKIAIVSLNALADAGFDVTFISSVGPVDPNINRDRVKVINFGFNDLLNNPFTVNAAFNAIWNQRCAVRFREILNEFDPADTIIHLHTWVRSLSASVVREATKRHFKIVCTLHDYFVVCPNGGLYNYQKKKPCNLIPMSLACLSTNCDSRSYVQKLWRITRQAAQHKYGHIPDSIQYFIIHSDYSESLLKPLLPRNAECFRVNNFIDIEKISPSNLSNNSTFTFIGRLSHEKGVALFAAAARSANVQAAFVGSGSDEQNIKRINPSAVFYGWQDRPGVIQAIRSSRAIVYPSLCHETSGLVVAEAAALGLPTIVADVCAAKDSIIDGKTGLLFRSGDVEDLAEKLRLLNSNLQFAETLGKAAYERYWAAPCTLNKHVMDLVNCYAKCGDDRQ